MPATSTDSPHGIHLALYAGSRKGGEGMLRATAHVLETAAVVPRVGTTAWARGVPSGRVAPVFCEPAGVGRAVVDCFFAAKSLITHSNSARIPPANHTSFGT